MVRRGALIFFVKFDLMRIIVCILYGKAVFLGYANCH